MHVDNPFNNPAGRLLRIFQDFSHATTGDIPRLAVILGIADPRGNADSIDVLMAVTDLHREFATLKSELRLQPDFERKSVAYANVNTGIHKTLDSLTIDFPGNSYKILVEHATLVALELITADLPLEEEGPVDEIENLYIKLKELQDIVVSVPQEEMSPSIRIWLLDLIRLMRDGLDRYKIRGPRGLRTQLQAMLGDLMLNYDTFDKAKKQTPSKFWARFNALLDTLLKLSTIHEKYKNALSYMKTTIPLLTGDAPLDEK